MPPFNQLQIGFSPPILLIINRALFYCSNCIIRFKDVQHHKTCWSSDCGSILLETNGLPPFNHWPELLTFEAVIIFWIFLDFYHFCVFFLLFLLFCTFCTLWFYWTVHMNFHAKAGVCSSKNGWVMSTFVLFVFFCTSCTFVLLYLIRTVHTNLHAKSGLCSSKN